MLNLNFAIFGYRVLTVEPSYLAPLVNTLIRRGDICDVLDGSRIRISARAYRRLSPTLDRTKIISVSEMRGLGGTVRRIPRHIPSVLALLVAVTLFFLSGATVLDIRVTGNERLSEAEVSAALGESGFTVGRLWSRVDTDAVALDVLAREKGISWLSINRRGGVAYVGIVESTGEEIPTPDTSPVNVVAAFDCVIDEITVTSGTPVVRVGDTVRRGDLLISGIVETERGTEYVHAAGSIRGTTSRTLTTRIPRVSTETALTEGETAYFALKILNFRINILNTYGKVPNGCVIIDAVKECSLFGKRLPVAILSGKYATETTVTRTLTDAELVLAASRTHTDEIRASIADADLGALTTSARFTDDGYEMTSRIVYSASVGEERPIVSGD